MGCCAQTNLGQNAFNLNVTGIRFDPAYKMSQKEIVDSISSCQHNSINQIEREVSGENFIRISIYHKSLGKEHFMKKEFAQAIIEYSKAIVIITHFYILHSQPLTATVFFNL